MIHTAQALQLVRRAQLDFLLNWTREQADQADQTAAPRQFFGLGSPNDSDKRDWGHLYDCSVLDD